MAGEAGNAACDYKYTDKHHGNGKSDKTFRINELHIKGKQDSRFLPGEEIDFELLCESMKSWDNINFRFEIQFQDGTSAAAILSDTGVDFKENEEKSIHMKLNTSYLMPGKYRVDIVAYVYNQFGMEQFVDGVYPGFIFEISDVLNDKHKLVWQHQYWGHVRLKDAQIIH